MKTILNVKGFAFKEQEYNNDDKNLFYSKWVQSLSTKALSGHI